MLLHPPDLSHCGQLYCFLLLQKGRQEMQRNSGRVLPLHWDQSTSKTALYIHLWSMMKSQKLEDKHFFFFFFCLPWQWGILFLWFLSSFPQPLLLCPLTSSLFYSGKSFIFSLVNLIHATGRETKPDTRTETLQDRKEKELLITKTKSVILFL